MKYDHCEGDSYGYFMAEQMSSEARNELGNKNQLDMKEGEFEAEASEIEAENSANMFKAEMSKPEAETQGTAGSTEMLIEVSVHCKSEQGWVEGE
eukprot:11288895-Alexandrium_andersonii.AAC.1